MAAPVRRQGDAPPLRPTVREQAHGDVHDLLRRGDELDPGTQAGGPDRSQVAGQRARVRLRGPRARLGRSAGEEHDRRPRLDGRLAGAGELAPVAKVFEIDGDELRRLVLGERLDQLRSLNVRLVAERDEAREPEPELGADHADLECEVAALGDEPDRAGFEVFRAELELRAGVVDAEAVRPDEDGPGGAHPLHDRALAGRSLLAHLAEPCADEDDALGARVKRVADRLLDARRRNRDDDELRRLGQLLDRRVRVTAEDLAALAVDEEHGAPVLALDRAAREPEAPLPGDARGTDDGDRARVEESREVALHFSRFREMIRRWMSDVPSSISSSLASRIHFSTGYSRE